MHSENVGLERLRLWAQILATIAVPIIVLIVGNQVQQSISEREVGKDYVQIAADILKAPPTPETTDLRQWAVATMDKLSPVPLSPKLREQLNSGEVDLKVSAGVDDAVGSTRLVRYFACEPAKDKATAQWLLDNFPEKFKRCPSEIDVGIPKFKAKVGPLKQGEVELKRAGKELEGTISSMKKTVRCVKAKDKEMVSWLLKEHSNVFYECPRPGEIGIAEYKKGS